MKRNRGKLLAGLMSLCLCLGLAALPAPAHAAPAKAEAYRAYYDYLYPQVSRIGIIPDNRAYFDRVGKAGNIEEELAAKTPGVLYAQLLDFDRDGVEELLYIRMEKDPEFDLVGLEASVYCYQNGRVKQAAETYQLDNGDRDRFVLWMGKTETGAPYFIDHFSTEFRSGGTCLTVKNGELVPFYSYDRKFVPDFMLSNGVYSTTGTYEYYVEGEKVSGETYNASNQRMGLMNQVMWDNSPYFENLDMEDNGIPSGVAQKTFDFLRPYGSEKIKAYYDPPAVWAAGFVKDGIGKGLVPQTLQNSYRQSITRAEFCALADSFYTKYTGTKVTPTKTFTDTDDGNVRRMATVGVVSGVGGGKFDPRGKLTREQAATMLSNLSAAIDNPMASAASGFADDGKISGWAKNAVGAVKAAGIMSGVGDNRFDPKATYTREQSIVTIMNMEKRVIPVTGVTLDHKELTLRAGTSEQLTASVIPANATNKHVTWTIDKSGNMAANFFTLSDTGLVTGVKDGLHSAVVTTNNGKTASCLVRVQDPNHFDVSGVDLPKTLTCLSYGKWEYKDAEGNVDYMPADPIVAGTVTIESASLPSNLKPNKDGSYGVLVTGRLAGVEPGMEENFYPYIKWKVYDENHRLVDSGLDCRTGNVAYIKVGDQLLFRADVQGIVPGNRYTIEVFGDTGRKNENIAAEQPTIRMPGLPLSMVRSEKAKAVLTDIQIERCEYRQSFRSFACDISFSGTGEFVKGYGQAPQFYWRLVASDGTVAAEGHRSINSRDLAPDGSFYFEPGYGSKGMTLEPGGSYTLEVQTQRF